MAIARQSFCYFHEQATQTYGRIRAELEHQGIVIGSMDMLIASQAISLG